MDRVHQADGVRVRRAGERKRAAERELRLANAELRAALAEAALAGVSYAELGRQAGLTKAQAWHRVNPT